MNNKNLLAWISLLLLTVLIFYIPMAKYYALIGMFLLVGMTAAKFLIIGFRYLELSKANLIWKISFVGVISGYAVLVLLYWSYSQGLN